MTVLMFWGLQLKGSLVAVGLIVFIIFVMIYACEGFWFQKKRSVQGTMGDHLIEVMKRRRKR